MNSKHVKVIQEAYTFDDLLLVPAYSEVVPAKVKLDTTLCEGIQLKIPVCSAAMDTVTEAKMAASLAKQGGLGFIHKNLSVDEQADMVRSVKAIDGNEQAACDGFGKLLCGAAVGVSESSLERVKALVEAGVDIIAVDSAHGHSKGVLDTIRLIRKSYPALSIVGGNIVTKEAALALIEAGANVVKVGVGPGSICTTRVVSGVGVPQISAIMNVAEVCHEMGIGLIADGGIKFSGDIVKAIAAGADCVMLGGLLAGTEETPGEVIEAFGRKLKTYVGMGSLSAMQRGSSDRYFQGGQKELKKLVPEGIEATVPFKGPMQDVVYQMMGGLRSGMGYCGCKDIEELKTKAQFVKISNAGLKESHPHTVENVKEAPNYRG